MFRKMRRFKQQLSEEECIEILTKEPRGVMAVLGDGDYPYTIPLDFYYEDGKLYFHGAPEGHKIDAIKKNNKVSFCVMDKGYIKDGDWALNIKSVVVFGKIRIMRSDEDIESLVRRMSLKYYPTPESVDEEIKREGRMPCCLELDIEHMTGKIINEK